MFEYIRGKLVQASPQAAIVDVGGVGYRILIPTSVFSDLPQIDHDILLYTSYVVREVSQTLYGFPSQQERVLFEKVMGVSGIGPKIALSLIGHLSIDAFHQAVHNNDIKAITRVPGIGKKTAERLIIEMRDKSFSSASDLPITISGDPQRQKVNDAMSALVNLGYNPAIAQKSIKTALKTLPADCGLGELISLSLKQM